MDQIQWMTWSWLPYKLFSFINNRNSGELCHWFILQSHHPVDLSSMRQLARGLANLMLALMAVWNLPLNAGRTHAPPVKDGGVWERYQLNRIRGFFTVAPTVKVKLTLPFLRTVSPSTVSGLLKDGSRPGIQGVRLRGGKMRHWPRRSKSQRVWFSSRRIWLRWMTWRESSRKRP